VEGTRKAGDIGGYVLAMTKFVRFFVQVAILGVGAWLVVRSELTSGSMIAASILLGRALAPVELAISMWRNFMGARFSYDRLKTAIDANPPPPTRTLLPTPKGKVEVADLTYLTPVTAHLILSQVSCAVEPGEALAIIGPSGAGKSTLCRLMVGLAVPNVGEIRLDGSPIHHWDSEQIGRHIGFLPQDVELFPGTVRDNIARMQEADDAAVVKAAQLAHAHDMIQHFPQGYDTPIGDGGVRLSGGQRQRIGLARAVFGNPRFIVLDEPNANLDQAGEAALAEAIDNLKRAAVALVIVGHRPSTLSVADKVLFLQGGRAVMFGERDHVLEALKAKATEPLPTDGGEKAPRRLSPGGTVPASGANSNTKAMAEAS
jgi:ATP-binding cassette subfamily C protein/ATP-binding cassette subfamily C exporter for protease/lipase/ATP-binding cassette subfamily C protein EexD